jgi:hypothetical protein
LREKSGSPLTPTLGWKIAMTLPPGCTDNMNIDLPIGRTLEEIVDLVLSMGKEPQDYDRTLQALESLGLSPDDAALAWDRVQGGVVRASTGRRANCPDKSKDALAWLSFQKAFSERSAPSQFHNSDSGISKPWWKLW